MTGVVGSGKSETGNFFFQKNIFASKHGLNKVTTLTTSYTGIIGEKCIKIIDTPGFMDPCSLTSAKEPINLADIPNGINAVALVINLQCRITREDVNLLERLSTVEEITPYTIIIFTHAKALGNTDKEQRKKIEAFIEDAKYCPKILPTILKKINNRFVLLESVEPMEEEYHVKKSLEFSLILQDIMDKNKYPLTVPWNIMEKQNIENVTQDMQNNGDGMNSFWQRLITYVTSIPIFSRNLAYIFFSTISEYVSELC